MKIQALLASAVVTLGASMLATTGAGAAVLDFSWVGSGAASGQSASWTQPSDPTPFSYDTNVNTVVEVTNGVQSALRPFNIVYFSPLSQGGGFNTGPYGVHDTGPQLYTGTEAMPIFSVGVTAMDNGTLTVTAVPELSTWAMMALGFAGLGIAGYRYGKVRLVMPSA